FAKKLDLAVRCDQTPEKEFVDGASGLARLRGELVLSKGLLSHAFLVGLGVFDQPRRVYQSCIWALARNRRTVSRWRGARSRNASIRRHRGGDAGKSLRGKPALSQSSVAVAPGSTAWMRMPLSASSCCSEWLSAMTNALLAPYTPLRLSGEIATTDPMLMIVPAPRATNAGAAA